MTTDQRLARVETQCRFFKAGFALMTVALAVVLFLGAGQDQDKPKVVREVRAKRFVVVDENGRNRIVLEVEEDNSSVLSRQDERERPRVHLEHRASGEYSVGLLYERSRLRAGLGAFPEGRYGGSFCFGVFNKSGQAKFTVADCATGYTYLSIIDKNEHNHDEHRTADEIPGRTVGSLFCRRLCGPAFEHQNEEHSDRDASDETTADRWNEKVSILARYPIGSSVLFRARWPNDKDADLLIPSIRFRSPDVSPRVV